MIIKEDKSTFENYLKDASNYTGSADVLYIPESIEELKELIQKIISEKKKITIQGSRTGLTGSAVSTEGVICSTELLTHCSINKDEKTAWVGPGLKYFELEQELKNLNLFFPPNPTETTSSIGGNLGANASGSRTFKYGATRNWVEEIKIILPNGNDFHLKRGEIFAENNILKFLEYQIEFEDIYMPEIKHSAGYYLRDGMDLIDLFIGSEGTLGVIYDIKLKLLQRPSELLGLIIYFADKDELFNFLEDVRDKSILNFNSKNEISARLIEYFDKNSLNILRKYYNQVPENVHSAIWIEQEIEENQDDFIEKWYEIIQKYTRLADSTWTAIDDKQHIEFAKFRHKLPEEVYENLSSKNIQKIGTDTAVKSVYFKDYYDYLYNELDSLGLDYIVFGHIGNSHLHANVFYKNENEMKLAKDFYMSLIKKTISLGGTVSAEHGIGKIKKPYLKEMYGEKLNTMIKIKQILDPNLLFGNGNLF
jgi:D-lactate dehydrogenase (cytochrome)